jgi:hypothetical protein
MTREEVIEFISVVFTRDCPVQGQVKLSSGKEIRFSEEDNIALRKYLDELIGNSMGVSFRRMEVKIVNGEVKS